MVGYNNRGDSDRLCNRIGIYVEQQQCLMQEINTEGVVLNGVGGGSPGAYRRKRGEKQ